MTTLQDLHTLIDRLPECEWPAAQQSLLQHLAKHDPVLNAFLNAPEDDEPETEAERAAMEEAYADIESGKADWVSLAVVKQRLAELP